MYEKNEEFEHEVDDSNIMDSGEEHPFDAQKVDISILTPNLDAIIKRLKYDEIDLMPSFQREGNLWTQAHQSRLIESLMIRIPIPSFYFNALNENEWQVVDGLQRLSAIDNFVVKKNMKLISLEFLTEYNGAYFDDLPRMLQRRIEEFQTTVYLIKKDTPIKMKYSLFKRINTGGLALKYQEIRHAMSQQINNGIASEFLTELTQQDDFINAIGQNNNRMAYEELILRYFAFKFRNIKEYKSSLPKFLDDTMDQWLGEKLVDDSFKEQCKNDFLETLQYCSNIFGEDVFRRTIEEHRTRRVINKPLFESLSVSISNLTAEEKKVLMGRQDIFIGKFKNMLEKDSEFITSIEKSTTNIDKIRIRFNKIKECILSTIEG